MIELIDRWMTLFKNHVRDSAERLQKGHGVHGQVQLGQVKGLMSKRSPEVSSLHWRSLGGCCSKTKHLEIVLFFSVLCVVPLHRSLAFDSFSFAFLFRIMFFLWNFARL